MIPDKVGHNDIYYTHEFTLNLLSNFWKFNVKLKDLKICVLLEEKGIEFKKCFFFSLLSTMLMIHFVYSSRIMRLIIFGMVHVITLLRCLNKCFGNGASINIPMILSYCWLEHYCGSPWIGQDNYCIWYDVLNESWIVSMK